MKRAGWLGKASASTNYEHDYEGELPSAKPALRVDRCAVATCGSGPGVTRAARAALEAVRDQNGRTVSTTFNSRGWATAVTDARGYATSFGYNAVGKRTSLTNARGKTTTWTLDDIYRTTGVTYPDQTTESWTYTPDSQVASHTDGRAYIVISTATQVGDHSVAYTYDAAYQLTQEVRTGSLPYSHSYSYDQVGNRLTKTAGGVTTSHTYGDNNQLLTAGGKSYGYDNNGNLTSVTSGGQTTTLTWDYRNKLTQISYPGGATNGFVTNELGHRVSKTDSGGTTTYLFDGSNVVANSRAEYTHGGVTGLLSERAGSVSKVYHGDPLGSTRGLTLLREQSGRGDGSERRSHRHPVPGGALPGDRDVVPRLVLLAPHCSTVQSGVGRAHPVLREPSRDPASDPAPGGKTEASGAL